METQFNGWKNTLDETSSKLTETVDDLEGRLFSTIDEINDRVMPKIDKAQRVADRAMSRLDNLWKHRSKNRDSNGEDDLGGHRIRYDRFDKNRTRYTPKENTKLRNQTYLDTEGNLFEVKENTNRKYKNLEENEECFRRNFHGHKVYYRRGGVTTVYHYEPKLPNNSPRNKAADTDSNRELTDGAEIQLSNFEHGNRVRQDTTPMEEESEKGRESECLSFDQ